MSSSDLAISARNIAKRYIIKHGEPTRTTAADALMQTLRGGNSKSSREEFWALRDVSFDVHCGEVIGIIGQNGAGKSTLLKILSRITEPTSGCIDLYGRVGSLLEVGTGFHPELTGRENIFLNGAILGMTRKRIASHFDEIVDFAGVEQFLDTPVKRFSSGMYVRLAFAVAAYLDPEILIVDEVLSVGDAEFQKKCLGKMRDVTSSGRTVLFVSHNMPAITNLCSSCVVLKNGNVVFQGDTEGAVDQYLKISQSGRGQREDLHAGRPSWARPWIRAARVLDHAGRECGSFPLGAPIVLEMSFEGPDGEQTRNPVMGITINHATYGTAAAVDTRVTGFHAQDGPYTAGTMRCTIDRLPFLQGHYNVDILFGNGPEDADFVAGCVSFDIEDSDIYNSGRVPSPHEGIVLLQPQWELARREPEGHATPALSLPERVPAIGS